MNAYRIYVRKTPLHKMLAESQEDAVKSWLDLMGYDSLQEAAEENFCDPADIQAREVLEL